MKFDRYAHFAPWMEHAGKLNQTKKYANPWDARADLSECRCVSRCQIWDKDVLLAEGYAFCSVSDNFSRKRGREISFGRAKKQLEKKGIIFDGSGERRKEN